MKGKTACMLSLLMLSLLAVAVINQAKAAPLVNFAWLEPDYVGEDPYTGENIVGYLEGTDWNFTMSYTNNDPVAINVSAVRTYFTWGQNYTYNYATPLQILPGTTYVFNMFNMTPSVGQAPEYWTYSYQVWIEHVNGTSPPYTNYTMLGWSGSHFAVLSTDHLTDLDIWFKYSMFMGGSMTTFPFNLNFTEAQVLFTQGVFELYQGYQIYLAGMFGTARTHLQNGDALFTQAITSWNQTGSALDDANVNFQNSQGNYFNALADSSRANGYGWLLFGLGWVFIGIGVIAYGARRPKTVVQS